jgi:pectate lyase
MKKEMKFLGKMGLSVMVLGVLILFDSCKKDLATPNPIQEEKPIQVKPPTQIKPGLYKVDFDGLRSDGGFSYKIGYVIEGGDSNGAPTVSILRLFENGVELHPPHSAHQDIRDFGEGRFSHWGTTLYFSTTNNTDPVANGKEYSYTIDGSGYPTN